MRVGEPRVVALLTPTPSLLEGVAEILEAAGYRVIIEKASQPEASRIIRSVASKADIVVVPGSWRGDWDRLSEAVGVAVVRGAWSPRLLAEIVERWGFSRLSPRLEAEKALGPDMARLAIERLKLLQADPPAGVAFSIGGKSIALRPPPITVVSEVYARSCSDPWPLIGEAYWRILEGADIVSIGWDFSVDLGCYWRILEEAIDRLPAPVAADPGRPELAIEAVERGAALGLSLTSGSLEEVPVPLRGEGAFVLIPSGRGRPSEELATASQRASELGFRRLILDPVARPLVSPGMLEPLTEAARLAGAASYPLMLGVNNAVELLDADTSGSTAALIAMAAEAGVSVILVSEESRKARGATWEAWASAAMASLSLYWGKPPKDLGIDVLVCKRKV
jgi:dihydropteroate synthase-like protein